MREAHLFLRLASLRWGYPERAQQAAPLRRKSNLRASRSLRFTKTQSHTGPVVNPGRYDSSGREVNPRPYWRARECAYLVVRALCLSR